MWSRGRGALGGAAAAWVLAVGCGGDRTTAAVPDEALRRDLRLAAASRVELAVAPDDSLTARFLPAAVEARPQADRASAATAAPRSRRRATTSHARATTPVHVASAAPVEDDAALRALVAASADPQPERIARFADQEGLAGYAAGYGGVALRGGAVGDDHCERDLPRRGPAVRTAVAYRPATVRLGAPPTGPRPGAGPFYAPPF